jgi:uncharacterized protein (UPF0305 family)
MKSSDLLLKLKKDIGKYKPRINLDQLNNEDENSIQLLMSRYNHNNYNKIINSSINYCGEEIDEEKLNDFICRIDNYFALYAPNQDEFKEFIKIISIYLTFISKKPLHPPGTIFENGSRVYERENVYYCTGKNIFLKDDLSLCEYCVSQASES